MSFVRIPFVNRKSVLAMAVVMAATGGLSGCGKGKKEDTRQERAVVTHVYGAGKDKYGNDTWVKNGVWHRPGEAVAAVTTSGAQVDSNLCDQPEPADGTVLGPDVDGKCFVTGYDPDNNQVGSACEVSSGNTRFTTRLGLFKIEFINNATKKTQHLLRDDIGVDIRIVDSLGAEVWSFTRDNPDYNDMLTEVGYLKTADTANTCKTIYAVATTNSFSTDSYNTNGVFIFDNSGSGYVSSLPPAYIETLAFAWDGKDHDKKDVPAGTYTVNFVVTTKDADTGILWDSPEPISITIAD